MMKSNLLTKIILLTAIAAMLAACGAFEPTPRPLPPLRVEYTLWWGDFPLLVAQEKGFFAKYGVEVEPTYYKIFSDSFSDLAAGQIDAALIAVGEVININRHTPVKIIGLEDDGGNMPIVARPEIKSIQDLKGKTIGTLVGTQYELLVIDMLSSAGMDTADVTIHNIDPEQASEALSKNEVQAAFTWEPYTTQAVREGAHILYPTNNTLRLFPDTIAFRQNVIDQRPEDIRAFMQAWFEAVNYSLENPEETRQIAAKYIGIPVEQVEINSGLKVFTYQDNLDMYDQTINPNSIFTITKKTAAYLIASGALAEAPSIDAIVTSSFLPKQK